jgi:hypothetical protein
MFEYDEKGKIFTDVVHKDAVGALIQTSTHLIRGVIHVHRGERIKNELDRDELFLAVTDARVLGADGETIHQAGFLAVLKSQIVWILPQEDEPGRPAAPGTGS